MLSAANGYIGLSAHQIVGLIVVSIVWLQRGSDSHYFSQMLVALKQQFSKTDLGDLHFFLGIEAHRSSSGLHLSQTRYTLDILERVDLLTAKPVSTPIVVGTKMSAHDGTLFPDATLYRSLEGALQFLTMTRPDITYDVNQVCQFMHAPTDIHFLAVKRIFRYLKGTLGKGLFFRPSSSFQVSGSFYDTVYAYSDVDWAGNPDNRRSTAGTCVFVGPNLISWSSKKQPTVSRSSTEAEYRALALAAAEVIWILYLLKDLGLYIKQPPTLFCDNINATYMASNPVMPSRGKHIDIDYHFVRERVVRGSLIVRYMPTQHQLADLFTKGLLKPRFHYLSFKLSIQDAPRSACGGVLALRMKNQ
ncbi:uncharacterized protein LOC113311186 [Papaver somniferum]|uniref:uncharacterized protein LOC113311186 n=1 Tax=Papaver somniferum TaxID=3469 RepID=UPI000E6F8CBF|nr:uncharacterized protein LOC113311186 [Papaver somniferum]